MAELQGMFSSGDILTAARNFSVSDKLWLAYADVGKIAFFARGLNKDLVTDAKFRWFEQDLPQDYVQIDHAAGYGAADTDLVVDDSSPVRPGTVLKNLSTDEQMRVTANDLSTNTITVSRGWGTTAAAAIADNDVLAVIGDAHMDGADFPEVIRRNPVEKYNYTQIFREGVKTTGTALATYVYYGDNETAALKVALEVHKRKIETSFLFGEPKEDLTGAEPVRATGGVTHYVTSNVTDAGGVLTEAEWENFVESALANGSEHKIAFVSPLIASAVSSWAKGKLVMYPKDKTYGMDIVSYVSPHGDLKITTEKLLRSKSIWNGYAFVIDMSNVGYRYLNYRGENRDTKLLTDRQNPGADAKAKEYLTECGLFLANENTHAILKGVTSYS